MQVLINSAIGTLDRVPQEVQEAADFYMSHYHYLPTEHTLLVNAEAVIRRAGYWSAAELASPASVPPDVALVMTSMVDANGRRRISYRIEADGIEIGHATHWQDREHYPWCVHLPAPDWHCTCRDQAHVLSVVASFVKPWER